MLKPRRFDACIVAYPSPAWVAHIAKRRNEVNSDQRRGTWILAAALVSLILALSYKLLA
jgi:hypothetical protein